MENTWSFSRDAWPTFKRLASRNPFLSVVALCLCCVPLPMQFSSISLVLLCLFSVNQYRKTGFFSGNLALWLPVLLYFVMVVSVVWSVDRHDSISALPKEIMFLLVPLCFMVFPVFGFSERQKILKVYSFFMVACTVFWLVRALVRFLVSGDKSVFFYHELVTKPVNAIHVSVYVAMAFLWMLSTRKRTWPYLVSMGILGVFAMLLSSKNVIVVFLFLVAAFVLFAFGRKKALFLGLGAVLALASVVLLSDSVQKRFREEFSTVAKSNTLNTDAASHGNVYNKSIREAWETDKFTPNDYLPGTALRVYQFRIFTEMLREDNIFFTGYGLNASYGKIAEKAEEHNLDPGYGKFNFHDQYVQNFADLGVVGFLLLLALVSINLLNGLRAKDFIHISFAVLMISLFLTESFLWRQRGAYYFVLLFCLFNSGYRFRRSTTKG